MPPHTFLLEETFSTLLEKPNDLIAQRSFFDVLMRCVAVNSGICSELVDKGFNRLLDFCDLALNQNVKVQTGHHLELLCSSLDEQLWERFLTADREYLLASLLMAASVQEYIGAKSRALGVIKDWTGQEVAAGKNVKLAIVDMLFGQSWSALYGDEISNSFVQNFSLLRASTPPFVFQKTTDKVILAAPSTLPSDMG